MTLDLVYLKKFWNRIAQQYGHFGSKAVLTPRSLGVLNWYVDFLQNRTLLKHIQERRALLDIGCGVGRWSIRMASRHERVVGIDFSIEMIKIAKSRANQEAIHNISFAVASASALPFKNDSFDITLSITVIQHILDRLQVEKVAQEIMRVTMFDGMVIILELSPYRKRSTRHLFPTAYYTTAEWLDVFLSKTGARLLGIYGVDIFPLNPLLEWAGTKFRSSDRQKCTYWYGMASPLFYWFLSALVLLAIPFDLLLQNILKKVTYHKIFIFRKSAGNSKSIDPKPYLGEIE